MIKADFLAYGPIGFQKMWLAKQGYEPQESLFNRIVEQCFKKELDLCAIVTEDDKIKPGFPEDRFGFLKNLAAGTRKYSVSEIGNSALKVSNAIGNQVILIDGQVVHAKENGKLVKHLVLGSNGIQQGMSLKETVQYCESKGLPQFLMDVYESSENRLSISLFKEAAKRCDGVIGHSSTNCIDPGFAEFLKLVPGARKLAKYTSYANERDDVFSVTVNKPTISVSRAHYIESIGNSYTEIPNSYAQAILKSNSNISLLDSIREAIGSWSCKQHKEFENPMRLAKYAAQLHLFGTKPDRFKDEKSSYND